MRSVRAGWTVRPGAVRGVAAASVGLALRGAILLAPVGWAGAQEPPPLATAPAQPAAAAAPAPDLSTPRRAMRGYLEAARARDHARAARYLDLRDIEPALRQSRGPQLARQLKDVLDQTLWVDLGSLSDEPAGERDDGLPARQERLGTLGDEQGPVDVLLERGADTGWRISRATLARVPELHEELAPALVQWLPRPLVEWSFLEIRLWQWAALAGLVVAAVAGSWLLCAAALFLARRIAARTSSDLGKRMAAQAGGPLRLLVAFALFAASLPALGLAVPAQRALLYVSGAGTVVSLAWLAFRLVDALGGWLEQRLRARAQLEAAAVVPPGRRVIKGVVAVLALLVLLQNLGINVTALLAGLGVGGIAVALAAQGALENLFGGLTLMTDRPVRVGDFCRFGDRIGTVEDIGLRSTRIRTLDRTVVTVPNKQFASIQLENFALRDRIWYHPRLGLRYETTPDQLRYVLVEIRRMLYAHPKVNPDPARIRFLGFGAYSLDLEVFAYVEVTDYGEYLEIAEDLNLRVMDIVAAAGTGFAFPSQTTYVEKGTGTDPERARQAEAEVARWREQHRMFLPRFLPEEIQQLRGTLDYPPRGAPRPDGG
jgi:MscS family membrane protein